MKNNDKHRLSELIDYLGLTPAGFGTQIGVPATSVASILAGKYSVSMKFAEKVMKRYPLVRKAWLILGDGEMLEKDYFRERYELYGQYHTDLDKKIEILQKVFDTTKAGLAKRLGLTRSHVSALSQNKIQSLNDETIAILTQNVKFIREEWWK